MYVSVVEPETSCLYLSQCLHTAAIFKVCS